MATSLFRMINSPRVDDACQRLPTSKATQFIVRGIVPGNSVIFARQFSSFFAEAGTHCEEKRLLFRNHPAR
jgi:hypothetical protein